MHLENFYTVQRTFADGDISSAGDNVENWDRAYDMYAEARDEGCDARIFYLEFVPGSCVLERATEVTADAVAEYEIISATADAENDLGDWGADYDAARDRHLENLMAAE